MSVGYAVGNETRTTTVPEVLPAVDVTTAPLIVAKSPPEMIVYLVLESEVNTWDVLSSKFTETARDLEFENIFGYCRSDSIEKMTTYTEVATECVSIARSPCLVIWNV